MADLIRVNFITAKGAAIPVDAAPGANLLEVAQGAGLSLEGTCEGQMACSTCHVIIGPEFFAALPVASEEEEDMLDLAADVARTSRLSCQIVLTPALDGIIVHIPGDSHNMQGR